MLMRGYFSAVLGVCLLASCAQKDPLPVVTNLVWSDEFDGNALDESKWEAMIGDGSAYGLWRWGNNEDQYYKKENAIVEDGVLKVKAMKESIAGYDYTSARLRSLNSGDFKYGRIEASIKMADTPGLWHAFWMLPSNPTESWPISGEIDIMEYVGNKSDQLLNTIHFADRFGTHDQIGESTPFVNDYGFHQYAVEWNENEITWFIDSVETYSVLRSNDRISNTWPFDAEFHLLLNTAIGGNLGGSFDPNGLLAPKYMEVDYVRVYQQEK